LAAACRAGGIARIMDIGAKKDCAQTDLKTRAAVHPDLKTHEDYLRQNP
jgi:hypothetical protein